MGESQGLRPNAQQVGLHNMYIVGWVGLKGDIPIQSTRKTHRTPTQLTKNLMNTYICMYITHKKPT
jgi:hypothetical protein